MCRRVLTPASLVLGVLACVLVAGCADLDETSIALSSTSVPAATSTSTTSTLLVSSPTEVAAFAQMVEALQPVPVFGLQSLPPGVSVADGWWPAIEEVSPPETGCTEANPHIEGEGGAEPEAQLLLSSGEGWLVVIENFRGDLGDVSGEAVGSVSGSSVHLYEVNGGWLAQWGYDGRWYGVFGRGVPRDTVTSTALGMRLIERY